MAMVAAAATLTGPNRWQASIDHDALLFAVSAAERILVVEPAPFYMLSNGA